jgi:hypothetical protein
MRGGPYPEGGAAEVSLLTRAKELFTRRGGTEAAKQDAQEVKDVAQSDASMGDKAKASAEAIKDPGAPGEPGQAAEPGRTGEAPGTPGEPGRTGESPGAPGESDRPPA